MLLSNVTNASAPRAAAAKAPVAQPPGKDEVFNYNPQDRLVMTSETKVLPNVRKGEFGPTDDHVMLREALDKVNDQYVYGDDDPRQNSSLAFASAVSTINSFLEVFPEPVKWAFKFDRLLIRPNCGEDFNANYKRESGTVNFYMKDDPVRHAHVHSGASADIVSHEVGHALLDAVRPEYMNAWGPEPGAFHEAFGDMMSIHMALRSDRVVQELVKQTGGDLSKPNLVAHMAEELGTGINNTEEKKTGGAYLRDANNTFKWQDPSKIADEKGGPGQLGWGKHSFSRVWTGAHFDLLKAMVNERIAAGTDPAQAIKQSNDELFKMLANMILESPHGKFSYRDMAVAFIQSDKIHNDGKRADLIQRVFTARDILPADLPAELLEKDEASRRAVANARLFQSDEKPLFENVQVTLGQNMGQFSGAIVDVPSSLDEGLFKSDHLQSSTEDDLGRLIKAGKIRYNDPNYKMKAGDEYNPKGEPFEGKVTWENGQMKIERLHISC